MPATERIIAVDGIDGSGKSNVVQACADWFSAKHKRVCDRRRGEKSTRYRDDSELQTSDALLVAEPTTHSIGAVIRDELAKEDHAHIYSQHELAAAFAIDRHILYRQLVCPFLEAHPKRYVIQDRSVLSSLVYQSIHFGIHDPLSLDELVSLPGNRFELDHPPAILFLLDLPYEIAAKRLSQREKQDAAIFESLDVQHKIIARYRDPELLDLFRSRGTHIVPVPAQQSSEEVRGHIIDALNRLFDQHLI